MVVCIKSQRNKGVQVSTLSASIVILTKNPGEIFKRVINAACTQAVNFPYEVLIIDSGSTDGTIEYIKSLSYSHLKLHVIPSSEFGHGRTRNLGVRLTSGRYVAFLTHDATPESSSWLQNLVSVAEERDDIAGVFGRHVAYDDADPFTRRELELHFSGFNDHRIVWMKDRERYDRDIGYRQFLHFFSDNNALIRRSVWEKIPYPDVDFAEDQAWAKSIIEHGFAKGYANDAVVIHSHVYSLIERLQRSFDESYAFLRLFGYSLCPNIRHLFTSWKALAKRDYIYCRQLGMTKNLKGMTSLLRALVDNLMRLLGHYIGAKGKMLPKSMLFLISRDQRVLKSLLKGN